MPIVKVLFFYKNLNSKVWTVKTFMWQYLYLGEIWTLTIWGYYKLIDSNFMFENDMFMILKELLLSFYRCFPKCLQMKWYGVLYLLLNILGM